jgi:hypothetical protein
MVACRRSAVVCVQTRDPPRAQLKLRAAHADRAPLTCGPSLRLSCPTAHMRRDEAAAGMARYGRTRRIAP